ncbi:MAG: DAK2 domain-containing protein [Clostridia bacterium]|nr:DAK2 domain-containing protein [Clostridia bacterium]
METSQLDGALFARMICGGARSLQSNVQIVNDLNVFPIPDGDTGDNMFMTIDAGAAVIKNDEDSSLCDTAAKVARGMLLGARGNSGVILSRIFAGIAKGLDGLEEADMAAVNAAFESGIAEAYGAVSQPVEGTILTVYKDAVHYAGSRLTEDSTLDTYLSDLLCELRASLERTPELLDVLKEAGVVDSGGAGFIYIAEGMQKALDPDADLAGAASSHMPTAHTADISKFTEDSVLEFGYCTEFLLRLQRAKIDIDAFDLDAFIAYLNSVGDSVVAFREGTVVKVHVHTKTPGQILNDCQQYGEFLTLKIENMTLQHNEAMPGRSDYTPPVSKPRKPYGIISVAAGKGIKDTFLSLGCDVVVDGGQSMNPSAEDIIRALEEVNADTIFVFPNNSNIILTAKQAAALYDKADVRVVKTKTIGEGYAAISMMDTSSGDADVIQAELESVAAEVVTGIVSQAVRHTEKDGVEVEKGDYIGFVDDCIYVDHPDRLETAVTLTQHLSAQQYDILLVVCGADVSPSEADRLYERLKDAYKRTEIVMIDGGQPIYDYILILE